ncbi:hypothetical protein ACYULU_11430 [Breznakiellaceae bacterium SP9]
MRNILRVYRLEKRTAYFLAEVKAAFSKQQFTELLQGNKVEVDGIEPTAF